jgi:hypothetical protein
MKKAYLFLLLFISVFIYAQDSSDYAEIDKDLYGINTFTTLFSFEKESDEVNLFNILYDKKKGLYKSIKDINSGKKRVDKLNTYLDELYADKIIRFAVRDSILLYVDFSLNEKLLSFLKKQNNNSNLDKLIEKRSNYKNYITTSFNFSTAPKRLSLDNEVSIILPNTNWQKMEPTNPQRFVLSAGDDSYTGSVFYSVEEISSSDIETVQNNFVANYKTTLIKNIPENGNLTKDDLYEVRPGQLLQIADSLKIGITTFDKIYEQITTNSDKYTLQSYVKRTRFYINGNTMYTVSLMSIMSSKHVLSDKKDLIKLKGYLLDTVYIMKSDSIDYDF